MTLAGHGTVSVGFIKSASEARDDFSSGADTFAVAAAASLVNR